jgi:hypothetical protein
MPKFDFMMNSVQSSQENKLYNYWLKIEFEFPTIFGTRKGQTNHINHIFGAMNIKSKKQIEI